MKKDLLKLKEATVYKNFDDLTEAIKESSSSYEKIAGVHLLFQMFKHSA